MYINSIPHEHQLQCPTCGQTIDMRDLGQVLAQGQYNANTGAYECQEAQDVQYTSSKKVGDSVEWTKGKDPINLN